jgi:hypothetical protein
MAQDARDDSIQRAFNEQKRQALEQRFGARCSFDDADVPPEIIGEWLDYIEEFETRYQGAGKTTVRAFIGSPLFLPHDSLSPFDISRELFRLVGLLSSNSIEVHFEKPLSDTEQYRFLTEELLDQDIDDIRIPGMTHNFLYGEIHAVETAGAVAVARHFLESLFRRDAAACANATAESGFTSPSGIPLTRAGLAHAIEGFLGGIAACTLYDIEELSCVIDAERGTVAFRVAWDGWESAAMKPLSASGMAVLRMAKSSSGWEVTGARVPGWHW